jgi:GNAT superfamily N-acetyltransferase
MSGEQPTVSEGNVPGALGALTALHATYYGERWTLGPRFEADIAEGLAAFAARYQPGRDGLWTVRDDAGRIRGGAVVDARAVAETGAQLRYVILDPGFHGRGLGRELLTRAVEFCDERGHDRVFLWTVDELEAAVHLYEALGFEATDTVAPHTDWETTIPYRLYERVRG